VLLPQDPRQFGRIGLRERSIDDGGAAQRSRRLGGRRKRYLGWELEDPAGKPLDEVRPIVDEIDRRVQELLAELSESAR
jgi:hypothetical protein